MPRKKAEKAEKVDKAPMFVAQFECPHCTQSLGGMFRVRTTEPDEAKRAEFIQNWTRVSLDDVACWHCKKRSPRAKLFVGWAATLDDDDDGK